MKIKLINTENLHFKVIRLIPTFFSNISANNVKYISD